MRLETAPIIPHRPRYRAARAFYLFLLLGACVATYALLRQPIAEPLDLQQPSTLHRRGADISPLLNDDEKCRLVHRAKDQCAFVKSQCPTDEGGFAAYLDLYFCKLPHAKAVAFIILILWLGLLFSTIGIAASDFFCINLSTIATILGMSESMAGVTFLAFGNGSPDVFSTFAAMRTNSGSLAVGELFGAAGFITAVVAGSMALIRPFHVARKSFVRDVGFFAVSAAFSMVFLWDGKLQLWECLVMVAFYIFYVAFVVVWHWWLGRRRRQREKEAAVRGHFVPPGDELEIEEEYRDDPDDAPSRPPFSRGVSREDWSALERGGETYQDILPNEDEEEEARDRWMSELNSNMRLTRPPARARGNTLTPVRPSLVGALEFQAVLKSLQKSRNIQTYPMNTRRYSDDPTYTTAQIQDNMSSVSDPASRPPYQVTVHEDRSPTVERPNTLDVPKTALARVRAVSANDAAGLRLDPEIRRLSQDRNRQQEDLIDFSSRDTQAQSQSNDTLQVPQDNQLRPPSQGSAQRPSINTAPSGTESRDFLAPPSATTSLPRQDSLEFPDNTAESRSPREVPHAKELPRISIPSRQRSPSSTPATSPFPRFHDDPTPPGSRPPSLYLPAASIASPESVPVGQSVEEEVPKRPSFLNRVWPYSILPPPGVMISTLFPTIYHWHEKNYWEKALGIVAAPSVFLLTITLPVVESGKDEGESARKDDSFDSARSKSTPALKTPGRLDLNDGTRPGSHHHGSLTTQGATGKGTAATVATATEQTQRHNMGSHPSQHGHHGSHPSIIIEDGNTIAASPQIMAHRPSFPPPEQADDTPEPWNRWLLITQLFLAPLFIVFAIYSQNPTDIGPAWLIQPVLICLLVSLVLLIPLLLTTTPTTRPPFHRPILSLAGFVVSIAWISTIASQVVGALKALAVIANMSHAIMGLTIFAVGNSLGDLVADVTVAGLGYPVMALSACFGGPMLNILLGIGISGSYIIIRHAHRRMLHHPEKDVKFKSYQIEVGNTLIVSGGTLLVTLVGLLVVVPVNRWVLSKRIGWALIVLWVLSTVGNVVLEVSGWEPGWGMRIDTRFDGDGDGEACT